MKPLTKEEMIRVIEGKGMASRVPMMFHQWIGAGGFGERRNEIQQILDKYPSDVQMITFQIPAVFDAPEDDPEYRWLNFDNPFSEDVAIDAVSALDDYGKLDSVLHDFPDPNYKGMFPFNPPEDGRYRLGHWWYWLFERFWSIRGMENALCDFYENEEEVHRLFRSLTDFYKTMITRGKEILNLNGIWTSDDIGTQTGPFFSLEVFRTFFKPYYKELIDHAHSLGMHFWLHTCGNVDIFLPELLEIGLDVIHPIQKYTMDEQDIAQKYGKDICIWAGFDVQQVIPYGSVEDVRQEVRFMYDCYARKDGRFIMGLGNGMTPDARTECAEAIFDEAYRYGIQTGNKLNE